MYPELQQYSHCFDRPSPALSVCSAVVCCSIVNQSARCNINIHTLMYNYWMDIYWTLSLRWILCDKKKCWGHTEHYFKKKRGISFANMCCFDQYRGHSRWTKRWCENIPLNIMLFETTYKGWSLVLKIFVCPLGFWSPTLNEPQVRPDQHYVCSIISDQVRSNSVAVDLSGSVTRSDRRVHQNDYGEKVTLHWILRGGYGGTLVHLMCPSTTTEGKKGLTVNWRGKKSCLGSQDTVTIGICLEKWKVTEVVL